MTTRADLHRRRRARPAPRAAELAHLLMVLDGDAPKDFSNAFVAADGLRQFVSLHPALASGNTVSVIDRLLESAIHVGQRRGDRLHRVLADTLGILFSRTPEENLARAAMAALGRRIHSGRAVVQRAVAAAMGAMAAGVAPRREPVPPFTGARPATLEDLVGDRPSAATNGWVWFGRTAVRHNGNGSATALKLAFAQNDALGLHAEAYWMNRLRQESAAFSQPFVIPRPMADGGVVAFDRLPIPRSPGIPHNGVPLYGLVFQAPAGYFDYPNAPSPDGRLDRDRILTVIGRSARLLGELTARGILHTAPIPLFHNRAQRARRADAGRYDWRRGGRLDRWLESCRYPNFSTSGLRDFEHMAGFDGRPDHLYRTMGDHFLSLILVAASTFRMRKPDRQGLDRHGRPVDARAMFDRDFFGNLIRTGYEQYYHGFVGHPPGEAIPPDIDALAGRLIEAMGVDRHMDEILRVADQARMSDEAFHRTLRRHGESPDAEILPMRGAGDIRLLTGPHLGEFNGRISEPALIDHLATAAALCVAGRSWHNRFGAEPLPVPPGT